MSTPEKISGTRRLAGATILLIDEDGDDLGHLHRLFEGEGAETRTAARPGAGLSMMHARSTDLLVIGLEPPVADGLALVRSIRRDADLQRTPAIGLAGTSTSLVAAEDAGIDRLFVKPVDDDRLISEMVRMLEVRRRGAGS